MATQLLSRNDRDELLAVFDLSATLPDDRTTDMQIAYEGVWLGHHSGQPVVFSEAMFDSWIAEFDRAGRKLLVDYEHQTEHAHRNGQPNPKAGRIQKLFKRMGAKGAELWGSVTFTDRAASYIRSDEYDSCSLVIKPVVDRRTGKNLGYQLTSVALTNDPFLDGLSPPVLMSLQSGSENMAEDTEEKNPPVEAAADEPTIDVEIDDKEAVKALSAMQEWVATASKLSGLDEDQLAAALSANVDKIMALVGTAVPMSAAKQDAATIALSAQVAELSAKVGKQATELSVMRDLIGKASPTGTQEPKGGAVIDLSAFNPTQLMHFNNLKNGYGYDDAKAFETVKRNPRMARQ